MYNKHTHIRSTGEITSRSGHWKRQSCIDLAKKIGMKFPITVSHTTDDTSGRGRHGRDAYILNEDGTFEREEWDDWGGKKPKADFIAKYETKPETT